jgi:hypothetical protein
MATLETKINRFYKSNGKYISLYIVDCKGNEIKFDLFRGGIPTVERYFTGGYDIKCSGFDYLRMFFPGLLGSEVLDTRKSISTYLYVNCDFTESLKKIFKYNIYKNLKQMTPEQREIAGGLRVLVDADEKQFADAFYVLKTCDKDDIRALSSVVYCLNNGIKRTKGSLAYGARLVWEALGQKAIYINKNSTYCFCM